MLRTVLGVLEYKYSNYWYFLKTFIVLTAWLSVLVSAWLLILLGSLKYLFLVCVFLVVVVLGIPTGARKRQNESPEQRNE